MVFIKFRLPGIGQLHSSTPFIASVFFVLLFCASHLVAFTSAFSEDLPDVGQDYENGYGYDNLIDNMQDCRQFDDCRDLAKRYARLNARIFEYYEAREIMFQKLDVQETVQGERRVKTIYSLKWVSVPFQGLPNHNFANTEHTFPQSALKSGNHYGKSQADLMHLFPALNRVNSKRGNLPFADCAGGGQTWKICPKGFEPPDCHKGIVARAMFYIAVAYDLKIDDRQESTLRVWAEQYPVSATERARAYKLYHIQGNRNPFIDNPDWIALISDF